MTNIVSNLRFSVVVTLLAALCAVSGCGGKEDCDRRSTECVPAGYTESGLPTYGDPTDTGF